jgi:hypothetical protein
LNLVVDALRFSLELDLRQKEEANTSFFAKQVLLLLLT